MRGPTLPEQPSRRRQASETILAAVPERELRAARVSSPPAARQQARRPALAPVRFQAAAADADDDDAAAATLQDARCEPEHSPKTRPAAVLIRATTLGVRVRWA